MRDKLLELREEGKNYKQISEITGLCKSTISYYIGDRIGRKNNSNINSCKNCDKNINIGQVFCNKECNIKYKLKNRIIKLESGELTDNKIIRKALVEKIGDFCSICKISSTWNNKKLTLEVDHIDGNSDNNKFDNLRLVCPNCHSQLDTSKGSSTLKKETKRNKYLRKYKNYE
jgi:predicted transcriptional regulator